MGTTGDGVPVEVESSVGSTGFDSGKELGIWTLGSEGPGPGTLTTVCGSLTRGKETRTAREWAFNAGLSTKAFPVEFRMKV